MIPVTDEQAKAVQEVAKATGKAIDLVGGVGAYLRRVIGTIPEDVIGRYAGDAIAEDRKRHKERLADRAGENLRDIPRERISAPSPSLLLPLLTAAEDEGREPLQDIWAALLANCMVDGGRKVRAAYFDIVRQLEPSDAAVLRAVVEAVPATLTVLTQRMTPYNVDENGCLISLDALVKLGLLTKSVNLPTVGNAPVPSPMPIGRGLVAACQVT